MVIAPKKKHNAFTTHEVQILRDRWPTLMPMADLLNLLPRHTENSITGYANKVLKLRRPTNRATPGSSRPTPAWDRVRALLEAEPRTQSAIASAMGFSRTRASQILRAHAAEVHILSWQPCESGARDEAVWAVGMLPDVHMPADVKRYRAEILRIDPFAGLIQQVAA